MKATVDKLIDQMQLLFKDLLARDIMISNVITISSDRTMEQAKELMRLKKISGLPVVDDGKLVGLVSIEDIIKALENREIQQPLEKHMTKISSFIKSPNQSLFFL